MHAIRMLWIAIPKQTVAIHLARNVQRIHSFAMREIIEKLSPSTS